RMTLICRLGVDVVRSRLPSLVRAVKREGRSVVWCCDPMHANTIKISTGYKTRLFETILDELRAFFLVHRAEGTYPAGVHVEMTGQGVTECIGGSRPIRETDLRSCYRTHCDPRLNAEQAIEFAFVLADILERKGWISGRPDPKVA